MQVANKFSALNGGLPLEEGLFKSNNTPDLFNKFKKSHIFLASGLSKAKLIGKNTFLMLELL